MASYLEQINRLLNEMTLEEKVGQLQQCGPSLVGAFDVDFEELVNMVFDGRITKAKFDELMSSAETDYHEDDLRRGKIGSYNGIADAKIINHLQKIAVEETRLGIPLLFGYDVIHGYRTITPIPLAESCAWDPKLWEATAKISAKEASAGGIHMTFAPMVDVSKDARWGRISEGAGEDVYLTSLYGVAKVKGFQGADLLEKDTLAACVKHFAGYGAAEAGRDYNRVDMSIQRLYEEYLPPFEACIKAGARAIMPAFNDINGIPCTVNKWLLTKVLREDWCFDGMTISDANAIAECVAHGIVQDRGEAAAEAIKAGIDMDMTSNCYHENLLHLLQSGIVSEEDLNQAVANILRIKFEMGLFEHPYRTDENLEKGEMLKPDYRRLAKEAACKSIVLLKNDDILPLQTGTRLAVVGELAKDRAEMTGTWAIKANGNDCVSLIDGCELQDIKYQYFTTEEIINIQRNGDDIASAMKALTSNVDVIVVTVGERKSQSGEAASRADITISEVQITMLEILLKAGKPVIAVLFNGRPLAIPWIEKEVPAILEAWHPGVEAGNAILDILFGKVNPSAKLTTTFPYASGQCPIYYDHINTGRPAGKSKFTSKYLDTPIEPMYPFGFGLSYSIYEYTELVVTQMKNDILISVKVKNIGAYEGEEIVQCYMHDPVAKRVRPVKKLVDFTKVYLKAGEEKDICFRIPFQKLGYFDYDMNYVVDDGEYEFFVGKSSVDGLSKCLRCRF